MFQWMFFRKGIRRVRKDAYFNKRTLEKRFAVFHRYADVTVQWRPLFYLIQIHVHNISLFISSVKHYANWAVVAFLSILGYTVFRQQLGKRSAAHLCSASASSFASVTNRNRRASHEPAAHEICCWDCGSKINQQSIGNAFCRAAYAQPRNKGAWAESRH